MTDPASIDEVPWLEPAALERWVRANSERVTPLVLERFLENERFVEGGVMPTRGRARCVVWKHEKVDKYPVLTRFNMTVYYTDVVSARNLAMVLQTVDRFRRWKLSSGMDL